jgi:hypothetical protein
MTCLFLGLLFEREQSILKVALLSDTKVTFFQFVRRWEIMILNRN